MSTYVLIPGAGGRSWYWHLVASRLEELGHDVVAPDLPSSDPTARLGRYVQEVIEAISDRDDLVVVGQSLGGLIAPLVCDRVPSRLLVLVAAMIPAPGETGGEWWEATGQPDAAAHLARAQGRDESKDFDPFEWFLHDVPPDIVEQSAAHVVEQSDGPFIDPWPPARGPAFRPAASPAATTACSLWSSCAGSHENGWASSPSTSTAAISPRSRPLTS